MLTACYYRFHVIRNQNTVIFNIKSYSNHTPIFILSSVLHGAQQAIVLKQVH